MFSAAAYIEQQEKQNEEIKLRITMVSGIAAAQVKAMKEKLTKAEAEISALEKNTTTLRNTKEQS